MLLFFFFVKEETLFYLWRRNQKEALTRMFCCFFFFFSRLLPPCRKHTRRGRYLSLPCLAMSLFFFCLLHVHLVVFFPVWFIFYFFPCPFKFLLFFFLHYKWHHREWPLENPAAVERIVYIYIFFLPGPFTSMTLVAPIFYLSNTVEQAVKLFWTKPEENTWHTSLFLSPLCGLSHVGRHVYGIGKMRRRRLRAPA